jgi:hypothetical protein
MYWTIVAIAGRKHSIMTKIATVGDFTVNANATDIKAEIPTAGMACIAVKMTTPSTCREFVTQVCIKDAVKYLT